MRKITSLLTVASLVCVQFIQVSSALANVSLPAYAMPGFYAAIDAGNLAEVKNIVETARAPALVNPNSANYMVDLNFRDAAGNTPLIRASLQPHVDVVKYILELGADINAYNAKYETSLIVAYNAGNFGVARYLLSKGAIDNYEIAQKIDEIDSAARAKKQYASGTALRNKMFLSAGAAAGVGAAVALGSGGGGGGGSGVSGAAPIVSGATIDCGAGAGLHPEACNRTLFDTTEANGNEGVLGMKADYAYARGYDGRIFNRNGAGDLLDETSDGRVKVAVLDTGVDYTHAELDSVVRRDLSVTCNGSGCVAGGLDTDGHGTQVAGVLAAERNETGTLHGIAPGVDIMAIGFANSAGDYTSGDIPGIQYAVANGVRVINGSYGLAEGLNNSLNIDEVSISALNTIMDTSVASSSYRLQFQNAVANNVIMVYAAGNDGSDEVQVLAGLPVYFDGTVNSVNTGGLDWSNNWVAVVSLEDDLETLSDFSQECGLAKDWCLAAPGELTRSTANGGGYSTALDTAGTSFAAPNVSGAIAIMLGAFPQLTPQEALQVLFDTATDLGAAGIDDVYGNGLVDLDKATDPAVGSWTLSVSGGGITTSSFSFSGSGFGLSAPFGKALARNDASIMFTDKYGKDYAVPLSTIAGKLEQRQTSFDKYVKFARNDFDSVVDVGEGAKLGFSSAKVTQDPTLKKREFGKFSYASETLMGADKALFGFNYQTNLNDTLDKTPQKSLLVSDALKHPYLNLANTTNSSMVGYEAGRSRVMMAAYNGQYRDEYDYNFNTSKRTSGLFSEYRYANNDNSSHIALSDGVAFEKNSVLGSETSGAFGIDGSTTYHAGLSAKYALADNVSLLGNAYMGRTNVTAAAASIFTGFDTIATNAFSAGVAFDKVNDEHDQLGFMLSQPLRVISGGANLMLPQDVASNGSILYKNQHLNLAPTGREIDIETYYHIRFDNASNLSFNAIFRMEPDHNAQADNEAAFIGKYALTY